MTSGAALLLARSGDRRFAFRVDELAAVLPLPRLVRPPGVPVPALLGFANIGGRVTPVVSPATVLGDPPPDATPLDTHLLLLRGAEPLALAVDRATEVVADAAIRRIAPEASANGWLAGEVGEGDAVHALVDTARLVLDVERTRLAALADAVAARTASAS